MPDVEEMLQLRRKVIAKEEKICSVAYKKDLEELQAFAKRWRREVAVDIDKKDAY